MFPYEFNVVCFFVFFSISVKNETGILIEIALNVKIAFHKIVILMILILSPDKHGMSVYFLEPFYLILQRFKVFSVYSFTSLVRFINKYFIFFETIVNECPLLFSLYIVS